MNTNWSKILVFGLLFGIAGFFIGRFTTHGHGERGGCHKQLACCDKDGNCEHGGTCCKPGGTCSKADCDHADKMGEHHGKACCKGSHGAGEGHRKEQGTNPGDAEADAIVKQLEEADFMGDTTIAIKGGEVRVLRSADNISVHVDMKGEQHHEHSN